MSKYNSRGELVRQRHRETPQQAKNRAQRRSGVRPLRGRFGPWVRDLLP